MVQTSNRTKKEKPNTNLFSLSNRTFRLRTSTVSMVYLNQIFKLKVGQTVQKLGATTRPPNGADQSSFTIFIFTNTYQYRNTILPIKTFFCLTYLLPRGYGSPMAIFTQNSFQFGHLFQDMYSECLKSQLFRFSDTYGSKCPKTRR